jgi:hypothetical protein
VCFNVYDTARMDEVMRGDAVGKGSVVLEGGDCDNGDNCLNVLWSVGSHRGTSDDESKYHYESTTKVP